jgi:5-methylcytosine-specific restriction endonuclease McrA
MTKKGTCALCKNEDELELSHIIPKFVFRYL